MTRSAYVQVRCAVVALWSERHQRYAAKTGPETSNLTQNYGFAGSSFLADVLAGFAGRPPATGEDALRELYATERLVREAGLIYWRDLRAHGPVSQLRGSTRRRGGAWPSWWSGVEQSLQRCEGPLVAAGQAVGTAWHELMTPTLTETTRSNVPRRSS